jgi:hypothetical protein
MLLKKLMVSPAVCAVLLAGVAFAGQKINAPQRAGKNAANTEKSTAAGQKGKWAQEKGTCESLNTQMKDKLAQEKQLHEQARADESQEKSILAQAKAVEAQRVALERTEVKGRNNTGIESEVRAKEQQRVALEHQAEEVSKQREQLEKQANELAQQRRSIEEEHKADCHSAHTAAK